MGGFFMISYLFAILAKVIR